MSQKRPFGPFWPVISEAGWTSRKKVPLGIRLKSTRPSHGRVLPKLHPPEARQNFLLAGLFSGPFSLTQSFGKAPPVEKFAWLPVGHKANKTGRGSVSLI